MRNPELQKWVYTLLERPVGASLFYYHALFGSALLLAIGLSVFQTTNGDDDGFNYNYIDGDVDSGVDGAPVSLTIMFSVGWTWHSCLPSVCPLCKQQAVNRIR